MVDKIPPEILLAQNLAANEKKNRDKALRKLQKYLHDHSSLPSGGFTETELLKIWKGLHYCMWMQDKPLIQEELSTNIASLIHCFNNPRIAMLFIKTFYITECREWSLIDKWRLDKFLMMFRNMVYESFKYLESKNWSEKLVNQHMKILSDLVILDHSLEVSPIGVKFHLADVYLPELESASAGKLGPKQVVVFLQPWIDMLSGTKCKSIRDSVIKNIFGEILSQSPVMTRKPREKDSKELRVNYRLLADRLLRAGSSDNCVSRNRPAIYTLVQNFRDVSEGKLPFSPEDEVVDEVEDLQESDIDSAVKDLAELNKSLLADDKGGKKRKRKRVEIDLSDFDEAYVSGTSSDDDILTGAHEVPESTDDDENKKPDLKSDEIGLPPKKKKAKNSKKAKDSVTSSTASDSLENHKDSAFSNVLSNNDVTRKSRKAKRNQKNTNNNAISGVSQVAPIEEDNSNPTEKGKNKKPKKNKQTVSDSNETGTSFNAEFEVEDFPQSESAPHLSTLVPSEPISSDKDSVIKPLSKRKKKTTKAQSDMPIQEPKDAGNHTDSGTSDVAPLESSEIAHFTSQSATKAKYFKKAMSQTTPKAFDKKADLREKSVSSKKKRISFGKSKCIAKNAVKLTGSSSFDPNRTPEQGILRKNPIKPGTVIQVGKQATMRNTLRNSKFPNRMVSADFF